MRLFVAVVVALAAPLAVQALRPLGPFAAFATKKRSVCAVSRGGSTSVAPPGIVPAAAAVDVTDDPEKDEIKCAFFRVIKPATENFGQFVQDVDREGLAPVLAIIFGWPMVVLQRGWFAAVIKRVAIDIFHLDGVLDGILSHKDLMWPHRAAAAEFLKARAVDGQISAVDLFELKYYVSRTFYQTNVTFASHNEVPLIFLRCGGDPDTGKVDLESVLLFFDGERPSGFGRITRDTLTKVQSNFVPVSYSPPSPFDSHKSAVAVVGWLLITVFVAVPLALVYLASNAVTSLFKKPDSSKTTSEDGPL